MISPAPVPAPPSRFIRPNTSNDRENNKARNESHFSVAKELAGGLEFSRGGNNSVKPKSQEHHGRRTFGTNQLETMGMSPSKFRAGGKKHIPAPYSVTDSAQEIIRAASAEGGSRPSSSRRNNNNNNGMSDEQHQASARRQERRLIESLIAFPQVSPSPSSSRNKKNGKVELQLSVPRAFQTDNVDWRPNGPHDHIPVLPEKAPKPPPKKIGPSEEDPKFDDINPSLLRPARHGKIKPLGDIKGVHHDELGNVKKVNSTEVVDKLWRDMENRKKAHEKAVKQHEKEDTQLCKFGPSAKKVGEEDLEDFVTRFQTQPLHSKEAKHKNMMRKYVPPLHKKHVLGKGEMKASTDRLYYQAKEKTTEAHEKARKKYVDDMQPKFSKISAEEVAESAARLTSREPRE